MMPFFDLSKYKNLEIFTYVSDDKWTRRDNELHAQFKEDVIRYVGGVIDLVPGEVFKFFVQNDNYVSLQFFDVN